MSVVEVTRLRANAGGEAELVANLADGARIIASGDGCRGVEVLRGIEAPGEVVLVVEWETVDAHHAFHATDLFQHYRATMVEILAEAPAGGHFERVASAP
ncbi:antibiotic biosynthesis monooxygenase family protein [Pseudonocardia humida]|uniref:Antibiotic biosynthesis monooxygenase n=1 Tax=Pseudonocardia humida TaxID=2800819 RepID=A0ABT1A3A4_9PSEU|nr:antibiotic biosynthesis monooxygenase family protein [Pseudonocardia humida]MCO1657489.1 antibiotic biosynthesis monooxygenase [Pseudonocardia humida]